MGIEYLDQLIYQSLKSRKEVKLFLCKDVEGGFGIKINGVEVSRNNPWEVFEYSFKELGLNKEELNKLGALRSKNDVN